MRVDVILGTLALLAFLKWAWIIACPRPMRDGEIDTGHMSARWLGERR